MVIVYSERYCKADHVFDGGKVSIKEGEKFTFKGFEWVALDVDPEQETVTAIMTKPWIKTPFDVDGNNDWRTSTIRQKLQKKLLPILGEENLVTHVSDLVADNGDRRYETCDDKIWLLSCDDFRKWRKIIMDNCDLNNWWWTLTPWYINDVGNGNNVRYINTSGYVSYSSAYFGLGVAPACVIHLSSLESALTDALVDAVTELMKQLEDLKKRIVELEIHKEEKKG